MLHSVLAVVPFNGTVTDAWHAASAIKEDAEAGVRGNSTTQMLACMSYLAL